MYQQIIDLIKQKGDSLVEKAGVIADIGVKKQHLTEMDLEIERAITKLVKRFPGEHAVYAEEENTGVKNAENVWIIDPISNTYNFIRGLPHYAVVVSHMRSGEVVFAAVYDPSMKELFTAEKGKGAFLNGKRINVNTTSEELCILYQYGTEKYTVQEGTHLLGVINTFQPKTYVIKSMASMAVMYSYVAAGRVEGVVCVNRDTFPEFAGKLLVEEAGGTFTDFEGKDLQFDTRGIVATNGVIHKELLQELKLNNFGLMI